MSYTTNFIHVHPTHIHLVISAEHSEHAIRMLAKALNIDIPMSEACDFATVIVGVNDWVFEKNDEGDLALVEPRVEPSPMCLWREDVNIAVLNAIAPFLKGDGYMGFGDEEFNEFRVVIKNGTITRETREGWYTEYCRDENEW